MLDASDLFDAVGGGKYAEPDDEVVDRLRFDEELSVPIEMTDLDVWANYLNDDLYAMDKKLREFFSKTRWKREQKNGYRTTASIVFAWMFGHKPEPRDGAKCRMLHQLLKYYCTSYTGETTFGGKTVPRVYVFSKYSTKRKRPYSLRLRLEEAKGGNPFKQGPGANRDKRSRGRRADS